MAKKANQPKSKAKCKAKAKEDALTALNQRKYYLLRKGDIDEAERKELEDLEQTIFAAKQAVNSFQ